MPPDPLRDRLHSSLGAAYRSRQSITAGIGTALAGLAILSGLSIGWAIAPVALVVLALAAAPHLRPAPPPPNER